MVKGPSGTGADDLFTPEIGSAARDDSKLTIVTAKHGQAPIDRNKARGVDDTIISKLVNQVQDGLAASSYADDDIMSHSSPILVVS